MTITLPAGWKPIESAPKDEPILVGPTKRMGICVARNDSHDGWVTETCSEWCSIYTPTHWMPLPAAPGTPPASAQDDAKDEREAMPTVVPDAIRLMAQRIAADKFEHCTADPIFTVMKRRLITGLDLDYDCEVGWFYDGEQITGDDAAALEAEYQEEFKVPSNYTRTGIAEEWEHHATYVTMESAQAFVKAKGDQYRVYVDSGCRNHEWQALRAFLLAIAASQQQEG